MQPNGTLLDLLLELQILDRVPRMGFLLRGVSDPESIAEHSWHVVFLVWALSEELPEIDRLKAMEMAMLHDTAEVRTGDLPLTTKRYFPEGSKRQAETAIIGELMAPISERALALFEEYEEALSPEARLVKACDKLQLILKVTVYEEWGAGGLSEFWENPANFNDGGFEPVRRLFAKLRQRAAQRSEAPQ